MAVLDKFRIKVDSNDVFNKNGTVESLREIHARWNLVNYNADNLVKFVILNENKNFCAI